MAKLLKATIQQIDLSLVDPPKALVRMEINDESISELAQSISEVGLIQAILVRPDGDRYEVVAGHRRYLACKRAGLEKVAAVVRKMSDMEAAIIRATENLQREDLTPIEEAAIYQDMKDVYGMTVDQIARKVSVTPATVMRRIALLDMSPDLQKAIHEKRISIAVGEAFSIITDSDSLNFYLSFAIDDGCTKEIARSWAKDWKDSDRRLTSTGGETPFEPVHIESKPHYLTCDICLHPYLMESIQSIMACEGCLIRLREKQREA